MSQIPFASIAPPNHKSCVYYMVSVYHFPFTSIQAQLKVISFAGWENRALGNGVDRMAAHSRMNTCPVQEISAIFKKKPFINNTESEFIKEVFVRAVLDIPPEL